MLVSNVVSWTFFVYGTNIRAYRNTELLKNKLKYFRRLLSLQSSVSNDAVLGECGRNRIYTNCIYKCIKYWTKILQMDHERLPKQTYKMLLKLDGVGRTSWVTNVKNVLFQYGFGYVWMSQYVGHVDVFLSEFKQRVRDSAIQTWHTSVISNSKLYAYSLFKSSLTVEHYLLHVNQLIFRQALSKFRCSCHSLMIEKGRHLNMDYEDRLCSYCYRCGINEVENEYHFLLVCGAYTNLRSKYLKPRYNSNPTYNKFVELLSCECKISLLALSKYVYFAMKQHSLQSSCMIHQL